MGRKFLWIKSKQTTGMALGCFNLGPQTNMSGLIGVPRILGRSQNLGDPPLRNSFCCCYENEWLPNYCYLSFIVFFFVWKHKLALSLVALRCCWSNTFAKLLWSTWLMWWTGAYCWKFMHPVMNAFFFPAFVESLQIINKSSPKRLVCSHPNYFSYLSKNWLSSSLFTFHCHVTGTFKWVLDLHNQSNNEQTWQELIKVSQMCKLFPAPLRS